MRHSSRQGCSPVRLDHKDVLRMRRVGPPSPAHCHCLQDELHTQQAFYWQHYRTNRIKEAAATAAAAGQQAADTQMQQQADPMVA